MTPAHESETIVFNFRKLLSTLPNYTELEQILLFSVNWGKHVCYYSLVSIGVNMSAIASFMDLFMFTLSFF